MLSDVARIAVIVRNDDDQQLVQRLLGQHHFRIFTHLILLNNTDEYFDSVVILHRKSSNSCALSVRLSCLARRLIILSDCSWEEVICDALYSGAHHYFCLQESERLLTVRLAAAMRAPVYHERRVLEASPYTFVAANRSVFNGAKKIDLSPREFELAFYLFSNRNEIILDSDLLANVWTLPLSMDTRRIDTAVCRVRHKLGLQHVSSSWKLIRLRGLGYELVQEMNDNSGYELSNQSNFVT